MYPLTFFLIEMPSDFIEQNLMLHGINVKNTISSFLRLAWCLSLYIVITLKIERKKKIKKLYDDNS